jgi:hypothetical protein
MASENDADGLDAALCYRDRASRHREPAQHLATPPAD